MSGTGKQLRNAQKLHNSVDKKESASTPNTSYVSITHKDDESKKKTTNNVVQDLRNKLAEATSRNDELLEEITTLNNKLRDAKGVIKLKDENIKFLQDSVKRLSQRCKISEKSVQTEAIEGQSSIVQLSDIATQTPEDVDDILDNVSGESADMVFKVCGSERLRQIIEEVTVGVMRRALSPVIADTRRVVTDIKNLKDSNVDLIRLLTADKTLVSRSNSEHVSDCMPEKHRTAVHQKKSDNDTQVPEISNIDNNVCVQGHFLDRTKSGTKVPHTLGDTTDGKARFQRRDTHIIVGSGVSDTSVPSASFSSAVRRAWLSVARADKDTTSQQVLDHLRGNFPGHTFVVEPLPVREDAKSIAFKVGADITLLDKLNRPELWPKGIIVKRYRFFRSGLKTTE